MRTVPETLRRPAALLGIVLLPLSAHAAGPTLAANGYELFIQASTSSGNALGAYYYNGVGTPGSTLDQRPGSTVSGTQDTDGAARSVQASLSAQASGSPSYSTGQLSASLQDASLRFAGEARPLGADYSLTGAYMSFADQVTFQVAGADASTQTRFHVQVFLDGTITATGDRDRYGNAPQAFMDLAFQIGGSGPSGINTTGRARTSLSPATGGQFVLDYADNGVFGANGGWTILANPSQLLWDAEITLQGAQTTVPFTMRMHTQCEEGSACDYGHTARFAFSALPTHVTYTSASGVFLTTPVPEPGTAALLAVGLAALPLWRRLRSAA